MARNINNITQTNGYSVIKPNINLNWSSAFMSKTNQGTGYCGKIIPVFIKELMPNQTVNLKNDIGIQFTPFIDNVLHTFRGEIITYFVPYRICAYMRAVETLSGETLEEGDQLKWKDYITGGKNGSITIYNELFNLKRAKAGNNNTLIHTLADYFGLPTHDLDSNYPKEGAIEEDGWKSTNMLLWNAYNLIYNTKLRNPDITAWKRMRTTNSIGEIGERQAAEINSVATGYWNADRFTRARTIQYRGNTPTVPLSTDAIRLYHNYIVNTEGQIDGTAIANNGLKATLRDGTEGKNNTTIFEAAESDPTLTGFIRQEIEHHTIPKLEGKFNLNDMLYNIALLKYETNNARMRPTYTDQLKYRWGITPQDSRFQEPEYISSNSFNIGIDTITQTSAGGDADSQGNQSYQGNITSQGWGSGSNLNTTYKAMEHGVIMSLMIIKPLGVYEGGLSRKWASGRTRFDFPTPEYMNLPDQKINKYELHMTGVLEDDEELFGWEQIYDEDRSELNQVCGYLRPSENAKYGHMTLARYFNSAPELNDEFLKCNPDMSRIKQFPNEPDFIFFLRTEIKTAMPMPLINDPIDIGLGN